MGACKLEATSIKDLLKILHHPLPGSDQTTCFRNQRLVENPYIYHFLDLIKLLVSGIEDLLKIPTSTTSWI
jgi:hypothetical protein